MSLDRRGCGIHAVRVRCGRCRFAVLETGDPLAGYSGEIEQRFASEQEPG
jgi:hypothetical protein